MVRALQEESYGVKVWQLLKKLEDLDLNADTNIDWVYIEQGKVVVE